MAQILGLMSSEQLDSEWSENARRAIFYEYPQGAAPLTGLLSMMEDEETDKPEFGWFEDRFQEPKTLSAVWNGAGPFSINGTDSATSPVDDTAVDAGDTLYIAVDDASRFRVNDSLWVKDVEMSSGADQQLYCIVTAINTSTNRITVRVTQKLGSTGVDLLNTAANLDKDVFKLGSAYAEGAGSQTGGTWFPIEPANYTQIFRTSFSFSRTALKAGVRWDSTGAYRDKAKKNGLYHMIGMEMQFLFGKKRSTPVTDGADSTVERETGGIMHYLEQWEAANSIYRGGSGAAAITANSDDLKRIVNINGTVSYSDLKTYLERPFRFANDANNEMLVLCGGGFINAFTDIAEKMSLATRALHSKDSGYGMSLVMWESPYGVLYLKSHPLMNRYSAFRNSAFFIDLGHLKYRYLSDSDTTLLTNRQNPDADRRKDEWLTEAGLEVAFPESHMFMGGVTGITV